MLRRAVFALLDIALTVAGLFAIVVGIYLGEPEGFQWSAFVALALGIALMRGGFQIGARV